MRNPRTRTACPQCLAVLDIDTTTSCSQATCGACEAIFDFNGGSKHKDNTLNQAAPHLTAMRSVEVDSSLDSIFLTAIVRLRDHWPVLLLTSLTANLLWIALIGLPADALAGLWKQLTSGATNGDATTLAITVGGTGLVGLLLAPVSAYCMIVLVRLTLTLTRYHSSAQSVGLIKGVLNALAVAPWPVLRLGGLFLIAGSLIAVMFGVGVIAIVVLSFLMDPKSAVWVGTLSIGTMAIGVVFLLQWLLWPAVFLIADGRADLMTSLSWGARLALRHRKLTLSLVTVYFILATAGSMLFYVGQIITTPLAMLPMAIGYLRITGGEVLN
ncbi:hypothetical protein [Aporhodopirellula aestuarii]|uniref:Glycerophosphoryl diester phosphodiesterase membrane domain-containing protein n=1 Tax=Aporhodopirellula aestuarii TaxID=2950107 RepID=A0ABT0U1Z2_9BACT|nr:hypothetical protein [Aporhodopirellula aestuarii]MCM2370903.1 hypothetical protein [Aporhodopirellula aestuarii]